LEKNAGKEKKLMGEEKKDYRLARKEAAQAYRKKKTDRPSCEKPKGKIAETFKIDILAGRFQRREKPAKICRKMTKKGYCSSESLKGFRREGWGGRYD